MRSKILVFGLFFLVSIGLFAQKPGNIGLHWVFVQISRDLPGHSLPESLVLVQCQGLPEHPLLNIGKVTGEPRDMKIPSNADSGIPPGTLMLCQSFMSEHTDNYAVALNDGILEVQYIWAQEDYLDSWGRAPGVPAIEIPRSKRVTVAPPNTMAIPDFDRNLKVAKPVMQGQDVLYVQLLLLAAEYPVLGEADGWFGNKTEMAVKQFQKAHDLPVTGQVDKLFAAKLIAQFQ